MSALRARWLRLLLAGSPVGAEALGEQADGLFGLRLTLTEGKYHQVKRMLAAVSNRVETLGRSRFGELSLPADLLPGQWRWLDGPQVLYPRNGN